MSSYNTQFGNQQGILSSLTNTLSPILNAGPNQEGFSAAEKAGLTGQAINATAANTRSAQVQAASAVGGNTGVTTGGQQQLQAMLASRGAEGLSNAENAINLKSAELGRENFFNAEAGLSGVAGLENPIGYAGQATGAGNSAFGSATTVQNMKNQEEAGIGGAVMGLGGKLLGGFAGGMGNLDNTGGSSFGEQVGNFFTGFTGGTS